MADISGYVTGGASSSTVVAGSDPGQAPGADKVEYWSLQRCKQAYIDYLGNKRDEIEEQKSARRYRHGAQWTEEELKTLKKRKQPPVTDNIVGPKIDDIVGVVERLRQDPKAYPRTPKHQQGADLATAVLRYVLDTADWKAKSPQCAEAAAIDGIGGIELELVQGDQGDPDVSFNVVQIDGFFYDPRSFALDFSDAMYKGVGKWVDVDVLMEMFPDAAENGDLSGGYGIDLTSNSDRDNKWFFTTGNRKFARLVNISYQHKGQWCWALFTGSQILREGVSPFVDEKGKTFDKFIMFSAAVDHDGDRYGFPRNLKGMQDEVNMRRSKGLHELNSRRLIARRGAEDDIERMRREAARPDGIILYDSSEKPEFDDIAKQAAIQGQLAFLQDARQRVERFGPNMAMFAEQGAKNLSGRAIALLMQAGIAQLGPYIIAYTGWKLRVYRAVWNIVQRHWSAERWIRVTDDEGVAQFVSINQMQVDPMTGMPTLVNAIGALDVDIILDEGPDTINAMADTHEALTNALPAIGKMLPPPLAMAALEVLVQTSALPADVKKKFRDAGQAAQQQGPPPEVQAELAKLEVEKQRDAAKLQLQVQESAQQIQIEREKAAVEMQIEREKAENAMNIETVKANYQAQIARNKAAAEIEISRDRAAREPKKEAA